VRPLRCECRAGRFPINAGIYECCGDVESEVHELLSSTSTLGVWEFPCSLPSLLSAPRGLSLNNNSIASNTSATPTTCDGVQLKLLEQPAQSIIVVITIAIIIIINIIININIIIIIFSFSSRLEGGSSQSSGGRLLL
jgi:hypothetical protein